MGKKGWPCLLVGIGDLSADCESETERERERERERENRQTERELCWQEGRR